MHSAEGWEEVLLPEIERQQRMGKEVEAKRAELEKQKAQGAEPEDPDEYRAASR